MISGTLAQLKLRNRLLAMVGPTTGSATLAATTTGYTRSTGSFVTDGFVAGMEILVAGFGTAANNGYGVVAEVAATTLTVGDAYNVSAANVVTARTLVTEGAGAARTISVGVPALRAWDNLPLVPVSGKPYIEEEFVPATNATSSIPATSAYTSDTGLYIVKWYGLSNRPFSSIRRCVDAVLAEFTPGTAFVLSDGTTLRIPTRLGPRAGQITPLGTGWSYCTIEVPYLGVSLNTIAA